MHRFASVVAVSSILLASGTATAGEQYGAKRTSIEIGNHKGFILQPPKPAEDGARPWVWYAPTIGSYPNKSNEWVLHKLLERGFYVCGVDVGESYGSPAGRKVYSEFHQHLIREYKLEPKARLLAQSRGGLMLYNWAVENPDKVRCIVGIYPVCDLRSYPGLKKAAGAYGLTPVELEKQLTQHNPIDRLEPLAKAGVPILHIHGDADAVVPLEKNSQIVLDRYGTLGGKMKLIVIPKKGHAEIAEYFQEPQLVQFLLDGGFSPDPKKWPSELVQFTPYKTNPVFTAAKGQWDAKIRERGWIMREDGVYKLWYTGYDGTKDGLRMLGYATSPDGIAWTRHPKNPLVKDHWVEDMMIVKHDGKYYMFAEGREDRAHMLVSDNGIDWKRVGQLDIRLKSGKPIADGPFGTPTVWRENNRWHLFYERNDLGIWLATSADLKVWTNVQDEPVMKPGPGEYDKDLIALNQIVKHKGRYYAYYHGSARTGPKKGLWSTNVATSPDLIHWEKYPDNPLLPIDANKSSGILVHDGERYRLYTMHPEVHLHFAK